MDHGASYSAQLAQAHTQADHRAIVRPDGSTLSHGQVFLQAGAAAARLAAVGLGPGDRVVLALHNSAEMLVLDRALLMWGLVRVAVSARLHPHELAFIARDCGASAVVCEAEHLQSGLAEHLPAHLRLVSRSSHDKAWHTVEALLAPGATPPPLPAIGMDDLASLMYTSGTSGRPKGAMNSQRNWCAMAHGLLHILPAAGPDDLVMHIAPMSHFSGSVGAAYALRGAAVAYVERFEPLPALQLAAQLGATCVPLVPTLLGDLTAAKPDALHLPALRCLPYGGAPVSAQLLRQAQRRFGGVLLQLYGLSEALIPITALPTGSHGPDGDWETRLACAGWPAPGVELRIATAEAGTIGEILVRGPGVTPGYWNAPERTREAIDAAGWFATGDVGRIDAEGRLHIVDRLREMIVSGGFNVYPAEVERVIAALDGVAEVAVIGIPHTRWGEAVAAIVVPRTGHRLAAQQIVDGCRAALADFKKPTCVEFCAQLPRNSTGKIDRRGLRARYWQGHSRPIV